MQPNRETCQGGGGDSGFERLQAGEPRDEAENTVVTVNGVAGGRGADVFCGARARWKRERFWESARAVRRRAASFCARAYKPRTSPYSFQGLGRPGCGTWRTARRKTVWDVTSGGRKTAIWSSKYADCAAIGGAQYAEFFVHLRRGRVAQAGFAETRDVVYARGISDGREYILAEGN